MKKEYIAPDLYFESFVLSESIATCSELGIAFVDSGFFGSDSGVLCDMDYDNYKAYYEGYCYFYGGNQVFSS